MDIAARQAGGKAVLKASTQKLALPDPQCSRMSYSVRRYWVDEFFFRNVSRLPVNSRVIDVGGLKSKKRGQFDLGKSDLQTIYVNLSTKYQPDVQADVAAIPFQDEIFDVAICSELLEHVYDPKTVLCEILRVLRCGGTLLVTVPFLYRIHGDPGDYGRYTDSFWFSVLKEVGFDEIVVERQGLFFSVLADFGKQYVDRISLRKKPFSRIVASWFVAIFQRWALKYEQRLQVRADSFLRSFTTGFGIVAVKR